MSNHKETETRLIFHVGMSNKAAVVIAIYTDVFLLVIYALGQSECLLPPWYMKIHSKSVNIKMIYDNLGTKISDVIPQLYDTDITGCNTRHINLMLGWCEFIKIPLFLTFI